MGVLDDAIREHLDLKRQRGADPSEVERQAAEALGPARREPPAAPAVEPVDAEVEAGVEPVEPVDDVPAAEPPTQLADELVPPAEPETQVAEPEPQAAEPGFELDPEPVPAAPPTEVREPEAEVTPLHPVEEQEDEPDEVPADERLADDGPLDFPEQKRQDKPLWFEQSPGRDLDFDD